MASNLTLRYVLGLALIALTMVSTFLLLSQRMNANRDDGYIINIAGMQRMLSQRIALLGTQLVYGIATQQDLYRRSLESAVSRMADNHSELVALASTDSAIGRVQAYAADGPLDLEVRTYLAIATRLIGQSRDPALPLAAAAERLGELTHAVYRGLLRRLDAAVTDYQSAFEGNIEQFLSIERLILGLGLLLLVLEVVFIFKPMVRRVDRTLTALESSNQELREFTYRISHDLRAPIASSLGLVAMAEDGARDNDRDTVALALSQVGDLMARMDRLIEDILAVARNRNLRAQVDEVPLRALVRGLTEKLRDHPGFDRVRVQVAVPEELTLITVRSYLEQILENLLSNAVKYQDPAQDAPVVKLRAHSAGGETRICVTDNGLGVPEEYRDQLFGMFKRFHPGVAFGSGLGLYLVRQNAIALGGNVAYEASEPGSCFTVSLQTHLDGDPP